MLPPNPLEGRKPPQNHPNLCFPLDRLGLDILQILLAQGAKCEGYNLTQDMAHQQTPQTPQEQESRASSCRGNEGTKVAVKYSHLHYCKYPLHFADMFTPSLRTSSPPISNLLVPKRTLRAGDKGTAALLSLACRETDRELIYIPSSALG